jgi:protein-L-isoaspartate(D-aspartate) O-methyltransferase
VAAARRWAALKADSSLNGFPGCGSGYLLPIFHLLVSPPTASLANGTGLVLGIDHLTDLTNLATANLNKSFSAELKDGKIKVITADGRLGAPESKLPEGGWDAIHVWVASRCWGPFKWSWPPRRCGCDRGAAAPSMPSKLVEQLKSPGRMFIPVGPDGGSQSIWQVDKDEHGKVTKERLFDVRYVPQVWIN